MTTIFQYYNLKKQMRTSIFIAILFPLMSISFILSYLMKVTATGWEQYVGLTACILLDGFFGIIAGIKKEGFKTYKALNIFKTWFSWNLILTVILITEKSFSYADWLSEVMIIPVVTFMLISALKNATRSGFVKATIVKEIMDKIDKHKDQ